MNIFAFIAGIFIALIIISRFNKAGVQNDSGHYPVLLATFPLYYWAFAIYAKDDAALLIEVFVGVLFIAIAWLAYTLNRPKSLILLALGFIGHGVYDVFHLAIYSHSVAPNWWPEFCGSIDVLLGVYVLWLARINHFQKKTA
jgi:hypothetical protein